MAERIVEFENYCDRCQYKETAEEDSPCRECLSIPVREDSRKPERFSAKVSKGDKNGNG